MHAQLAFIIGTLALAASAVPLLARSAGLLARGEATAPELLGALALTTGGLGMGLIAVAPHAGPLAQLALLSGLVLVKLGLASACFFAFRVFGRGRPFAALLVSLATAILGASLVLDLLAAEGGRYPLRSLAFRFGQFATALPFAWLGKETLWQFRASRRRLSLGLTDRNVSIRFLLWAVACGGFLLVCALAMSASFLESREAVGVTLFLRGVVYTLIATAVWLAFYPPRAFRRRLEARA